MIGGESLIEAVKLNERDRLVGDRRRKIRPKLQSSVEPW
jgi:hypothetical protein